MDKTESKPSILQYPRSKPNRDVWTFTIYAQNRMEKLWNPLVSGLSDKEEERETEDGLNQTEGGLVLSSSFRTKKPKPNGNRLSFKFYVQNRTEIFCPSISTAAKPELKFSSLEFPRPKPNQNRGPFNFYDQNRTDIVRPSISTAKTERRSSVLHYLRPKPNRNRLSFNIHGQNRTEIFGPSLFNLRPKPNREALEPVGFGFDRQRRRERRQKMD
ncbi:hypothetical protein LguiB_031554 [Lonicera macranthoides]